MACWVVGAAEVLPIPATKSICERIFRRAGEVLTKCRMSLHGSNFERSLMANYITPKWQGINEVTIPELNDEIEGQEVLTQEVLSSLSFSNLLRMPMIYRLKHPAVAPAMQDAHRDRPSRYDVTPPRRHATTVFGGRPPGCRRRAAARSAW